MWTRGIELTGQPRIQREDARFLHKSLKSISANPEFRKKRSEIAKAPWANPKHREKMVEARRIRALGLKQ